MVKISQYIALAWMGKFKKNFCLFALDMYFNIINYIFTSLLSNYSLGEGCSHSAAILLKIEAAATYSQAWFWRPIFSPHCCLLFTAPFLV